MMLGNQRLVHTCGTSAHLKNVSRLRIPHPPSRACRQSKPSTMCINSSFAPIKHQNRVRTVRVQHFTCRRSRTAVKASAAASAASVFETSTSTSQSVPPPLPNPPVSSKIQEVIPYLIQLALSEKQLYWRLGFAFACMVLSKAAGLACPVLLREAVNHLSTQSLNFAVMALLMYGAAGLIKDVAKELQHPFFTPVSQAVARRVSYHTFSHVLDLDMKFHLDRRTGRLAKVLERGARSVYMLYRSLVFTFMPTAIELVFVCALLWTAFSPVVAAVVGATFVAYVAYTLELTQRSTEVRKQLNTMDNMVSSKAVDALLNYETVALFNNQRLEVGRYDSYLQGYQKSAIQLEMVAHTLGAGQAIILTVGLTSILLATLLTAPAAISPGDIVMVQGLILQLWAPLMFLGWFYRELRQSLVDMEEYFQILQTSTNLPDGKNPLPLHPSNTNTNTAATNSPPRHAMYTADVPSNLSGMSHAVSNGVKTEYIPVSISNGVQSAPAVDTHGMNGSSRGVEAESKPVGVQNGVHQDATSSRSNSDNADSALTKSDKAGSVEETSSSRSSTAELLSAVSPSSINASPTSSLGSARTAAGGGTGSTVTGGTASTTGGIRKHGVGLDGSESDAEGHLVHSMPIDSIDQPPPQDIELHQALSEEDTSSDEDAPSARTSSHGKASSSGSSNGIHSSSNGEGSTMHETSGAVGQEVVAAGEPLEGAAGVMQHPGWGLQVDLKDVRFGYQGERLILQGVTLEVPAGTSLAVVGPSGSGKSTILKLITRLYDVQEGSILVNGMDVRDIRLKELRNAIAVVPQDTVLFNDTVMENIRYGRPEASDEEVIEAAKMAKLHDAVQRMKDGYQTTVGERGLKLSGGEKQRVAIARAFLKAPRLLVCDEATSALDSATEAAIMSALSELAEGRTSIFVAHRLSTIKGCDRIVVLNHGQVAEVGSHEQLLSQGGLYASMWDMQAAEEAEMRDQVPKDGDDSSSESYKQEPWLVGHASS